MSYMGILTTNGLATQVQNMQLSKLEVFIRMRVPDPLTCGKRACTFGTSWHLDILRRGEGCCTLARLRTVNVTRRGPTQESEESSDKEFGPYSPGVSRTRLQILSLMEEAKATWRVSVRRTTRTSATNNVKLGHLSLPVVDISELASTYQRV